MSFSEKVKLWFSKVFGNSNTVPPINNENSLPPRPRNRAEIVAIFGANVEGGSDKWESENLKFCEIPDSFTAFPLKNGKRGFICHKKVIPAFQLVFNEIAASGLSSLIYSFDGCYNPRKITGGTALRFHAYGIAIDINYEGNTYGDSTPSMDKRIVAIFKKYNFDWGGDYSGNKDGMHFEYFKRS